MKKRQANTPMQVCHPSLRQQRGEQVYAAVKNPDEKADKVRKAMLY